MRMAARIAALHAALWISDRWYRLCWYVWPASLALLISSWIVIEKPHELAQTPSARPVGSSPPKPASAPPTTTTGLPASWPERLQKDMGLCSSTAVDLNPLIEACTRLIDSGRANDSQLAAAYAQRGNHQRLQQPERALEDYNAALRIEANTPKVLTNRAFIYMTRGQYDAAIEDLNNTIDHLPPKLAGQARYYRGFIFLQRKDYDRALIDLNEAVKLDGRNPDVYLTRGEVEQGQRKFGAAVIDFNAYNKLMPRDSRGLVARSSVMEATGRAQEALADLERALVLDPANARALAARDRLRAQQQNDAMP